MYSIRYIYVKDVYIKEYISQYLLFFQEKGEALFGGEQLYTLPHFKSIRTRVAHVPRFFVMLSFSESKEEPEG